MSIKSLPPKPDNTGYPRPPSAPLGKKQFGRKVSSGRKVIGPEGKSPTLEWYRADFLDAFMPPVILCTIGIAYFTIRSRGFDWMDSWLLWASILWPLLLYFAFKSDTLAAGADWIQRKNAWVETYNLTTVKIAHGVNKLILELSDKSGRELSVDLPDIQQNQELWDLVYNGILHSVCQKNAVTDGITRSTLKLPHPAA